MSGSDDQDIHGVRIENGLPRGGGFVVLVAA
jgi:hypothetical protein